MQAQTNRTGILAFLILFQVVVCFGGTAGLLWWSEADRLNSGITVADVAVGRMTTQEALAAVKAGVDQSLNAGKLELLDSDGKRWVIDLDDLSARVDLEGTIEKARQIGRHQNPWLNALERIELLNKSINIPLQIAYDPARLEQNLIKAGQYLSKPAVNARAGLVDDKITITPEATGHELDLDGTMVLVKKRLAVGDLSPISVKERELLPAVKTGDLAGITDILGIFVTRFNQNEVERTENIKIAARAIDGIVLGAGQEFSLNKQLGSRLAERGYKKAPVFWNDQVILAEGGGVCQVATTLYNAVLQANLEVRQRYPHSQLVNYAPPGQDATIAGEELDLKFANTTRGPVFITAVVDEDKLIVRIFGINDNKDQQIKIVTDKQPIEPKVIVEVDQEMPAGAMRVKTPGKEGYEVKVYRVVEQSGKEVGRQLISTDVYPAKPTIVQVGPKTSQYQK